MTFLDKIQNQPQLISFQEVITYIEEEYEFKPTRFTNGSTVNEAGQNNGSCKIFSFAKLKGLSEAQTLALFGDYYRKDVLGNTEGTDHQNIRTFMKRGWEGIEFEGDELKAQ